MEQGSRKVSNDQPILKEYQLSAPSTRIQAPGVVPDFQFLHSTPAIARILSNLPPQPENYIILSPNLVDAIDYCAGLLFLYSMMMAATYKAYQNPRNSRARIQRLLALVSTGITQTCHGSDSTS